MNSRKKRGYSRDVPQELVRDYRLFAIACEGGKREPDYFKLFEHFSKRVKVDVIEKKFLEGMSFVFTCINPPAHSPGNSGTNALLMMILSIMDAGIRSKEKVLRSGSVLVNNTPLNMAWL